MEFFPKIIIYSTRKSHTNDKNKQIEIGQFKKKYTETGDFFFSYCKTIIKVVEYLYRRNPI